MAKPDVVHYAPHYSQSWALIIGIDKYRNAPPLQTAANDARAIADLLVSRFGFDNDHVVLLLDEDATRDAIHQEHMKFTDDAIGDDDRVFIYFAGHGFPRVRGNRELTFLVPVDGNPADLASVLRLDSFLRDADLMRAKHIFYVLDSCYSGAGLKRVVQPGATRFLENMLQRSGRQLLASGKADETVADDSGPRPGHSVFAGHFLNGLEGRAETAGGVLTAQNLMAYVYNNVSKDLHSRQTPHYGWLDGDGDFVFRPLLTQPDGADQSTQQTEPAEGQPVMVELAPPPGPSSPAEAPAPVDRVLEYLEDERHRIKLDRYMAALWRELLPTISGDFFATPNEIDESNLTSQLRSYEDALRDMYLAGAAVARWGEPHHQRLLAEMAARSVEHIELKGGLVVSLAMRYYPAILLTYASGITAVSSGNYGMMRAFFDAPVRGARSSRFEPFVLAVGSGHLDIVRSRLFKLLPEHERHYVPLSEYLYKALQPELENLLAFGRRYEQFFDEFEVLYALVHADRSEAARSQRSDDEPLPVWGPVGRFAWKQQRDGGGPFTEVTVAAQEQQDDWPPISAGLFRSYEQFQRTSEAYRTGILQHLPWW